MAKKLLFLATISVVILLSSCQKEELVNSQVEKQEISLSEEDQLMVDYIIETYNVSKDNIHIEERFISVDGDISFPKEDFWENYGPVSSPLKTHYKQDYLVTSITSIPVYVNGVSSDWANAIADAIDEWNNLNGSISFYGVSSNNWTNTGINIYYDDLGSLANNIIARASQVRTTGYPGNTIRINTGYNRTSLSSSEKKFAMVHEIGHCIGFWHTDSGQGNKITDVSYWCRNFSNSSSVMNSVVSSWNGFSNCDEQAFDALY